MEDVEVVLQRTKFYSLQLPDWPFTSQQVVLDYAKTFTYYWTFIQYHAISESYKCYKKRFKFTLKMSFSITIIVGQSSMQFFPNLLFKNNQILKACDI